MDAFAQLVKHRDQATRKIKVHKTYINEDPNVEEVTHCPKCWSRNQQSTVRYMFVNMNEAIYKCEAATCMYPFRNFKYKNYTDQTVYYYTGMEEEEAAAPMIDDFLEATGLPCKSLPSPVKGSVSDSSSLFDFNLDCFSPEKATSGMQLNDIKTPDRNIFGSPSLLNLVKDFDTGFIDDILSELGGGTGTASSEKKSSPVARVTPPKPVGGSKQLKRCLQMFQPTKEKEVQGVFKVPPVPGAEPSISPKSKTRKSPGEHRRRHKHQRRPKFVSLSSAALTSDDPLSSEQILQKTRLSPLQFIESLNNIKPADGKQPVPVVSGIQRLGNQKVERMLNFIERSMKKRSPGTETLSSSDVRSPLKQAIQFTSAKRKDTKKLSLSAAVLEDSQFQYEGAPEELVQENVSEVPLVMEPTVISPVKEVIQPSTKQQTPPGVLPSFDELIDFIHPPDQNDIRWNCPA